MKRQILTLALCLGASIPLAERTASAQSAASGLRYWLPVDVVVLDVTVVTKTTTEFVPTLVGELEKLTKRTTTETTREGQIAVRTLADYDDKDSYSLDSVAGKLANTGLTVQVSAGGLLQSVQPSSKGRGAEVLTAVAKFVGTVASVITKGPLALVPLSPASMTHLKLAAQSTKARHAKVLDLSLAEAAAISAEAPTKCDPFAAPVSTRPIRLRALVSTTEEACLLFWQIDERGDAVQDFEAERLALETKLATIPKPDQLEVRNRIAELTKFIAATNVELAQRQAKLLALLEAFVIDQELGEKVRTERFSTTMKLTELTGKLEDLKPEPLAFFKRTGVLVLGQRIGGAESSSETSIRCAKTLSDKDLKKCEKEEADEKTKAVAISFRQARPWRIEVRASKCSTLEPQKDEGLKAPCGLSDAPEVPKVANTELRVAQVLDLIAGDTPTSSLSFTSAAFADKGLSLEFDEKGRPTKLLRTDGSSLAGVVSAIAGASTAARDEYAAGLSKLVEIQASRQKLALVEVNSEIERLQKQKELLDAKLGVAKGGQSFEVLLEQNQLNSELSLLKTKLDSQKAQAGYDQALEIEILKSNLEKLKVQIDLLNAQKQYDAAKGGS